MTAAGGPQIGRCVKSIPSNSNLSCLNSRETWEHAWGIRPTAYMYNYRIFALFVLRSCNRLLGFPGFEESPTDGHLYISESTFSRQGQSQQ